MKTKIIKSFFILAVVLLASCESEVRMPEVTNVAFPLITLDAKSDILIQGGVLNGVFNVDMYWDDKPVDSRVVVVMNGDYKNIKVLTESVKTFPTAQTLTDTKLLSMFGLSTIKPGDNFRVGLDVQMQDGKWYPAFNPEGVAYGSGPSNLPGASPTIVFKAVCALNIDEFVGTASIKDPFWVEGTYAAVIEKVDDTHLKIKNFAEFDGDIIITINKSTHTVKVDKQVYDKNLAAWGLASYTNPAVAGKGDIDACNKKINLILDYTVDQGGFGTGPITISY